MHIGNDGKPARNTISVPPSRSTATTSCAPQSENHRRPSCQRGDSPNAIPVVRACSSDIEVSSEGITISSRREVWWVSMSRLCARRLDADHDISDFLACLDIPVSLNDLIQLIPPVDERLKLSGLDQFLEMPYRRLVELWQGKHDLLATKERSDEYQNQEQQTSLRGEIDPARLQQPPTSAERALADRIEDHVVFLIVLREVLRRVVDDPAGARPEPSPGPGTLRFRISH